MESDVFGLDLLCTQEMGTGFSLQNGLQKTGRKVNLMVNFSLAEDNFQKQSQQLKKELQSIHNGKT